MEGVQKVKMDFPLVETISRDRLINWFRETLNPKLRTIKELGYGADFCLCLEMLFPGCIGKHRIKVDNPSVYDRRQNYKLLQSAFNSLKLNKDVPIEKLEAGNYRETYQFALWFKAFFEANYKGTKNGLKKYSAFPIKKHSRKATGGGFRQATGSCQPTEIEITEETPIDLNEIEKESLQTNSPLQSKENIHAININAEIINSRMSTFHLMEQETPKLDECNETLEQKQIKALTRQTEELERAVKNLTGCETIPKDISVDFEKRIVNQEQLESNMDPEVNKTTDLPILPEAAKDSKGLTKEENERVEEEVLRKSDLEIQLDQIHQVVSEQKKIIDVLEQQKKSRSKQIKTLEGIVYELTRAIKELEASKQNQADQIEQLRELTAMQQNTEDLEQIMNEQLKSLEDLTRTKEEHIRRIEELEQTNADLILNKTVLTKSNKAMAVQIEDLELSHKELTQQNDNLTKCNKELACHYNDLSNENRELSQRNNRLAKNYETILCYSCLDANLYFKQLVKIEKACKKEPNSSLRHFINVILNQTKYYPTLAPGLVGRKEQVIANSK